MSRSSLRTRRTGHAYVWRDATGVVPRLLDLQTERDARRSTFHHLCALLPHPLDSFNQAHLFHLSSLEPGPREVRRSTYSEAACPGKLCGSPLPDADVEAVGTAYDRASRAAVEAEATSCSSTVNAWRTAANPTRGERRILAAMT